MRAKFKFREWLTLKEAAHHLTDAFGDEFVEADLLRLALDKRLTLSVRLNGFSHGKKGVFVHRTELGQDPLGAPGTTTLEIGRRGEGQYLVLEDEISVFHGLWDLPMMGSEYFCVENEYQRMTGGIPPDLVNINGVLLGTTGGAMVQLQECRDAEEGWMGAEAQVEVLRRQIDASPPGPDKENLVNSLAAECEKLQARRTPPTSGRSIYYPAVEFPSDSTLVLRASALSDFEERFLGANGAGEIKEKPLTTNERNTLLVIIGALCDHADIDLSGRKSASEIVRLADSIGATLSDDTARQVLKKIPDAIGARSKK